MAIYLKSVSSGRAGFLKFGALIFGAGNFFSVGEGHPVYRRMFGSIFGLYPLDVRSIPSLGWDNHTCLQTWSCIFQEYRCSQLRTTDSQCALLEGRDQMDSFSGSLVPNISLVQIKGLISVLLSERYFDYLMAINNKYVTSYLDDPMEREEVPKEEFMCV